MRCNTHQIRQLHAVRICRTPALGGHLYMCAKCCEKHMRYNSCRNRNCSQCQNTQRQRWEENQQKKLINTTYFHVVFTIPEKLRSTALQYQREVYSAMFRAAWETLYEFGWNNKYLGAQIGSTMVLHTWGANLSYHPHIHCIVPGGGVTFNNKWRNGKYGSKFLFPIKAMAKVFRGKLLFALKKANIILNKNQLKLINKKPWVVYAKPPTGNANVLIKYLSRYVFKAAITHHRIVKYNENKVTFKYTDYRHKNQKKQMTLSSEEFVRRLSMHILPHQFCKVRHYGILSGAWKNKLFPGVESVKKQWDSFWLDKGVDVFKCPFCKTGKLLLIQFILPNKGPP